MKIKKDKHDDRWYVELSDDIFIHTINEWSNLFNKYNWYEWTPVAVRFEWDKEMTGGYEFEVIVLGIGFRFRHTVKKWFKKTELSKRLKNGIK